MIETKDGGSAFPLSGPLTTSDNLGMTLRDYFAAKAMQSLVALDHTNNINIAIWSYEIADAMLAARERRAEMSGNCKDCRHWAFHQDMRGKEWHECDAVDWRTRAAKVENADFAIYTEAHDDSGLWAGLRTGPMFGCVQFQQKGAGS